MLQLLNIEWHKYKSYRAFWFLLGGTILAYIGATHIMTVIYERSLDAVQMSKETATTLLGSNPFSKVEVWHTMAYILSYAIFIPALLIIMVISNEYTFKTYKQNIITGWTRSQALLAKLAVVVVLSILITLVYSGISLYVGGKFESSNVIQESMQPKYYMIGGFLLQTFAQLSLAFALGYAFKRSFIALGFFLFWSVFLEFVIGMLLKRVHADLPRFLPFEMSDRIVPLPAFFSRLNPDAYALAMDQIGQQALITGVFVVLLWYGLFQWNKTRNL
jgi:ABC-2 type transport system permease protein